MWIMPAHFNHSEIPRCRTASVAWKGIVHSQSSHPVQNRSWLESRFRRKESCQLGSSIAQSRHSRPKLRCQIGQCYYLLFIIAMLLSERNQSPTVLCIHSIGFSFQSPTYTEIKTTGKGGKKKKRTGEILWSAGSCFMSLRYCRLE